MRGRQGNTLHTFGTVADMCTLYLNEIFPQAPAWTVPKNFAPRLQELGELVTDMQQTFVTRGRAAVDSQRLVPVLPEPGSDEAGEQTGDPWRG